MEWIDINIELPENDQLVLVCLETYDPCSVLSQNLVKWIFQGIFTRSVGWKIFFLSAPYKVIYWMPLPLPPESKD